MINELWLLKMGWMHVLAIISHTHTPINTYTNNRTTTQTNYTIDWACATAAFLLPILATATEFIFFGFAAFRRWFGCCRCCIDSYKYGREIWVLRICSELHFITLINFLYLLFLFFEEVANWMRLNATCIMLPMRLCKSKWKCCLLAYLQMNTHKHIQSH